MIAVFVSKLISALSFSTEIWLSLLLGAVVTIFIAYTIYRVQKKEAGEHLQKHESRFDKLEQMHQQDSEKIKVLYELIIQSQKGSLGDVEAAVLEQKIEVAADKITEQDSDKAQVLKAIAEKDKEEADDLLDKIAKREHDLVEVYDLRAKNEFRNGFYTEAVKWYRKIVELEPENTHAFDDMLLSLIKADEKKEARKLAMAKLDDLDRIDATYTEGKYNLLWNINLTSDSVFEPQESETCLNRLREAITYLFGEESIEMACLYVEFGTFNAFQEKFAEAEDYYQKALDLKEKLNPGAKDKDTEVLVFLANALCWRGQYQDAVNLYDKIIREDSDSLGTDHPALCETLQNQAHAFTCMGKHSDAEANLIRVKNICEAKLGTQHEQYLSTMEDLSQHYIMMGQTDEAEAIIRTLLEIRIAKNGAESTQAAFLYWGLAVVLADKDDIEAEKLLNQAMAIYEKYPNETAMHIVGVRKSLADMNYRKGNYASVIPEYQDIIRAYESNEADYITFVLNPISAVTRSGHIK